MDMLKEVDGTSYKKLLNSLDGEFISFTELVALNKINKRYIVLRHDLDRHTKGVLEMSEIEHELGIKANYFPLHTAEYFDYSKKLLKLWQAVQDNGHEIGLHNDFLGQYFLFNGRKDDLRRIISQPINFLRDGGINISGTSSHGNGKLMNKYGVRNYEVWKDFCRENDVRFEQFYMKDFNLLYESYHISYDFYLTDTKRCWTGCSSSYFLPKGPYKFVDIRGTKKDKGYKIIDLFNNRKHGVLQILAHVPRWRVIK